MASRPQLAQAPVIIDGDMSANIISTPTIIQKLSMVSYSYSWSGSSPSGTVTVEVSNDYRLNAAGEVENAGTWTALSGVSGAVSGNSGTGFIDVVQTAAYAIRTKYTATSGSGTLQATVNAKVA